MLIMQIFISMKILNNLKFKNTNKNEIYMTHLNILKLLTADDLEFHNKHH